MDADLANCTLMITTDDVGFGNCSNETIGDNLLPYQHWYVPLFLTLAVITSVGNGLIIILVLKTKVLRTVSDIFMLSLALSDFLNGSVVTPWMIRMMDQDVDIYDKTKEPLHKQRCIFNSRLSNMTSLVSLYSLFFLTTHRFLSVKYPLRYPSQATKLKGCIITLSIWISGLLIAYLPEYTRLTDLSTSSELVFRICGTICGWSNVYIHILTLGAMLPAVLGVLVGYSLIAHIARGQRKQLDQYNALARRLSGVCEDLYSRRTFTEQVIHSAKSSRIYFIIFIGIMTSWVPFITIINIMPYCGTCNKSVMTFIIDIFFILGLGTSAINPWIYTLRNRDYRSALRNICSCVEFNKCTELRENSHCVCCCRSTRVSPHVSHSDLSEPQPPH